MLPRTRPKTIWRKVSCANTRRLQSGPTSRSPRRGCFRSETIPSGYRARFSASASPTARRRGPIRLRRRTVSNTRPKTAPLAACTAYPAAFQPRPEVTSLPSSATSRYSERKSLVSSGSTSPHTVAAAAPAAAARTCLWRTAGTTGSLERRRYAGRVPEGDSLHRAARRLQVLVGERLEVSSPHPRGRLTGVAERLDGRRLESVEAVGKNLLLRFEGDVVLRSHLRMTGRWWVHPRGRAQVGRPWLVLRGAEHEAVQLNGPVLELESAVVRRLGPDILAEAPEIDAMVVNLRAAPQELSLGEALQRQRLVAGIGNMWMAETLWEARLSPWRPLGDADDEDLRRALEAAHRLMSASVAGERGRRRVYRRVRRPCPRWG